MQLRSHGDARAFRTAADELLLRDEARHNLIFGICSTLLESPDAYAAAHFWTAHDRRGVVGAAVMTPPFNIVFAEPTDPDVTDRFVEELVRADVQAPGVTAAVPEADAFADAWRSATATTPRLRMRQGIYAARSARIPTDVAGGMRVATIRDRPLVIAWTAAFQREVFPKDAPLSNVDSVVDRRLASADAGFVLWQDAGVPVSLCGYGGRTPRGIRIGPVYTPPDARGRGYASALVARLTQHLLDGGVDFCFLYTDLANPTSNRIYVDVGYERVCDSADYAF